MSIVLASADRVSEVIRRLAPLGYAHLGNQGIEGREAFSRPDGLPAHNLYACAQGSLGLENHLAVRDYLRMHPNTAQAYGELKKQLAHQFPHDIDRYLAGKTDLILSVLREQGVSTERLARIEQGNRAP